MRAGATSVMGPESTFFLPFESVFEGLVNYYVAFSIIWVISYYSLAKSSYFKHNKRMRRMVSLVVAIIIGAWLGDFLIEYQVLSFLY